LYGELSAMLRHAGGLYVYLEAAYNTLVAALYGRGSVAERQPGTIAAVGVAFDKYTAHLSRIFPDEIIRDEVGSFKLNAAQLVSIAIIVLLTFINSKGVRNAKYLQTFFTFIKIASLVGLVVLGFSLAFDTTVWDANWNDAWNAKSFDSETGSWISI